MSGTADLVDDKHGQAFTALDANQDGYLEWQDLQDLVDRYIGAYKLDRDDRRARGLQAFYQMYWLELLRHAGVEGERLALDQYVAASRLASADTSRLNIVEGTSHAMFDVIDVNGDNEISKDEYARGLRDVWQVKAPDAMDAFTLMDTDGDGAISRQEFVRAMREYFHSNDAEAAGSVFFGRV